MSIWRFTVDRLDYTHDYALELIEQLTGDKKKAETMKKSRIQMLKSVPAEIFSGPFPPP